MSRLTIKQIKKGKNSSEVFMDNSNIKICLDKSRKTDYMLEMNCKHTESKITISFSKEIGTITEIGFKYEVYIYCPINEEKYYSNKIDWGIPVFEMASIITSKKEDEIILYQLGQKTLRIEINRDPVSKMVCVGKDLVFELNGFGELCAIAMINFQHRPTFLCGIENASKKYQKLFVNNGKEIKGTVESQFDSTLNIYFNYEKFSIEDSLYWRLTDSNSGNRLTLDIDSKTGLLTQICILYFGGKPVFFENESVVDTVEQAPLINLTPWSIFLELRNVLKTNSYKFMDIKGSFSILMNKSSIRIEISNDTINRSYVLDKARFEVGENGQICAITIGYSQEDGIYKFLNI